MKDKRQTLWNALLEHELCYSLSPKTIDSILDNSDKFFNHKQINWDYFNQYVANVTPGLESFLIGLSNSILYQLEPNFMFLADEAYSILRSRVLQAIPKFIPASGSKNWGFEPYLRNFAIKSAKREIITEIKRMRAPKLDSPIHNRGDEIDNDGDMIEFVSYNLFDKDKSYNDNLKVEDLDMIFGDALKKALLNHPGKIEYCLYYDGDMTLEQIAKFLNITVSQCYRRIKLAEKAVTEEMRKSVASFYCTNQFNIKDEISACY